MQKGASVGYYWDGYCWRPAEVRLDRPDACAPVPPCEPPTCDESEPECSLEERLGCLEARIDCLEETVYEDGPQCISEEDQEEIDHAREVCDAYHAVCNAYESFESLMSLLPDCYSHHLRELCQASYAIARVKYAVAADYDRLSD